jgi:hypothetical protein
MVGGEIYACQKQPQSLTADNPSSADACYPLTAPTSRCVYAAARIHNTRIPGIDDQAQ